MHENQLDFGKYFYNWLDVLLIMEAIDYNLATVSLYNMSFETVTRKVAKVITII